MVITLFPGHGFLNMPIIDRESRVGERGERRREKGEKGEGREGERRREKEKNKEGHTSKFGK